jgi:hypothetical protein
MRDLEHKPLLGELAGGGDGARRGIWRSHLAPVILPPARTALDGLLDGVDAELPSSIVDGWSWSILGGLLEIAMVLCSIFKPSSTYFKV